MKPVKSTNGSGPLLLTRGTNGKPTRGEIARCAYTPWEQKGLLQDRDLHHWLQAESQLRAMHKDAAFQAWQQARGQQSIRA